MWHRVRGAGAEVTSVTFFSKTPGREEAAMKASTAAPEPSQKTPQPNWNFTIYIKKGAKIKGSNERDNCFQPRTVTWRRAARMKMLQKAKSVSSEKVLCKLMPQCWMGTSFILWNEFSKRIIVLPLDLSYIRANLFSVTWFRPGLDFSPTLVDLFTRVCVHVLSGKCLSVSQSTQDHT